MIFRYAQFLLLTLMFFPQSVLGQIHLKSTDLESAVGEYIRKADEPAALLSDLIEDEELYLIGGAAVRIVLAVENYLLIVKKGEKPKPLPKRISNLIEPSQDFDIFINQSESKADDLKNNIIQSSFDFIKDSSNRWSVSTLKIKNKEKIDEYDNEIRDNDRGVLDSFDFAHQSTDLLSSIMIRLTYNTDPKSEIERKSVVSLRGVRGWGDALKAVKLRTNRLLIHPQHKETSMYESGRNPEIISVARFLANSLRFGFKITDEDYRKAKNIIIDAASGKLNRQNDYVKGRLHKIVIKSLFEVFDLKKALKVYEEIGLLSLVRKIEGRDRGDGNYSLRNFEELYKSTQAKSFSIVSKYDKHKEDINDLSNLPHLSILQGSVTTNGSHAYMIIDHSSAQYQIAKFLGKALDEVKASKQLRAEMVARLIGSEIGLAEAPIVSVLQPGDCSFDCRDHAVTSKIIAELMGLKTHLVPTSGHVEAFVEGPDDGYYSVTGYSIDSEEEGVEAVRENRLVESLNDQESDYNIAAFLLKEKAEKVKTVDIISFLDVIINKESIYKIKEWIDLIGASRSVNTFNKGIVEIKRKEFLALKSKFRKSGKVKVSSRDLKNLKKHILNDKFARNEETYDIYIELLTRYSHSKKRIDFDDYYIPPLKDELSFKSYINHIEIWSDLFEKEIIFKHIVLESTKEVIYHFLMLEKNDDTLVSLLTDEMNGNEELINTFIEMAVDSKFINLNRILPRVFALSLRGNKRFAETVLTELDGFFGMKAFDYFLINFLSSEGVNLSRLNRVFLKSVSAYVGNENIFYEHHPEVAVKIYERFKNISLDALEFEVRDSLNEEGPLLGLLFAKSLAEVFGPPWVADKNLTGELQQVYPVLPISLQDELFKWTQEASLDSARDLNYSLSRERKLISNGEYEVFKPIPGSCKAVLSILK